MKKLLIILILLMPINANAATSPACMELGEIAELIAIAKVAGMPKFMMIAGLKIDKTGMAAMDTFAINLVEEAFKCKHLTVDKFTRKTIRACNKLMFKKNAFKFISTK